MRAEESRPILLDDGIVVHAGEIQHHLIHFRIAVASDCDDGIGVPVEHLRDLRGIVPLRKRVAWAVVHEVAKQYELVASILAIAFK